MSKNTDTKKVRESRSKRIARVLSLILALLMIGGSAYYMIYLLIIGVSAADTYGYLEPVLEDVNIRIGLKYGSGVPVSYETTAANGYTLGSQPLADGYFKLSPFWKMDTKTIAVATHTNLVKESGAYAHASNTQNVSVGCYHVEFTADYSMHDSAVLEQQLAIINRTLAPHGFYAFPSYLNGNLRIRVGAFSTRQEAEAMYPVIAGFVGNFSAEIVDPSPSSVIIIDPSSNQILFTYDCSDGTSLGLAPIQGGDTTTYTKSSVGNVYEGVFAYNRHCDDGVDGVAVINVLTLDQYVQGVLPYEISNSWPIETQKACAIVARSYAASCLGNHAATNGFDLCNSTHCQAYHGAGRVNDKVIDATVSTHGLIVAHKGNVAPTYYASSSGGYTINSGDVWGGTQYGFLTARSTPWERYTDHAGGFWTKEISPEELLDYLVNTKNRTELAGGGYIKSIEVLAYASNTPYVKTVRITAANGASITLNYTDNVRLGLGLKSANFVVGQGSVVYTEDTVEVLGDRLIDSSTDQYVNSPIGGTTSSEGFIRYDEPQTILTENGTVQSFVAGLPILTASGSELAVSETMLVLTSQNMHLFNAGALAPPSSSSSSPTVSTGTKTVKDYTVHTETKTAYASSSRNFIFVGKGTGHGTGLSQWGAKDLGDLGYNFLQILNAYFTDIEVVYYKELEIFRNR
ncbi:MAG: SpoIID/LytB domain-containing protein [Clostridia bacterium]|nr:SpoIID/LytB domain-containing protein [Clostridia bacterium]